MKHDEGYFESVHNLSALLWHDEVEVSLWLLLAIRGRVDIENYLRDMQIWHLQWWC